MIEEKIHTFTGSDNRKRARMPMDSCNREAIPVSFPVVFPV
jgi:hypothetical protein